ncbi:MAG: FG-GAP-like repeat-containing protein, partial [Candidatus Acidiferrum sp.]
EVDLAVANRTSNNVTILLGSLDTSGNFTFTEAANSPITVGSSPVAIATGDLNADGVPDLAVVSQGNSATNEAPGIAILLGSSNADGTFAAAQGSPLPTASTPAGIVIANFASGTVPDLAVTNQGSSTLGVYLGLGQGTFAQRIELNTPTSPSAIITGTLSSSGLPDVALVAQGSTANQGDVTVFLTPTNLAGTTTGGSAGGGQQPFPGSQFEDLGVKIKATPALHPNGEVTLQLEFEIRALAGSSVNGIPVLSNRTLSQTVRVKEEETTMIGGLTDSQETRSITGLPGFAELPGGLGYGFGNRTANLEDTEMLILITPHRLRLPVRKTRTIFTGRGSRIPL